MSDRAGEPITGAAVAMLDLLGSVGATIFDVTLLDIQGSERRFERARGLDELRRTIGRSLTAAATLQYSFVIRPRSATALLVQLDDLNEEQAARLASYAFMEIRTSPGSHQIWLAVSDGPKDSDKEAARQFRSRIRQGVGTDKFASGATRIAGSFNFKTKYAPNFPTVALLYAQHGGTATVANLEKAGLIAPPPPRPRPVFPLKTRPHEPPEAVCGRTISKPYAALP
jgi:RepB DNA-primase from phage plasmid